MMVMICQVRFLVKSGLLAIFLVNCVLHQVEGTEKDETDRKWLTNNTNIKMAAEQNSTTETTLEPTLELTSLKNVFNELVSLFSKMSTIQFPSNDKTKKAKSVQEMTSRSYSTYGSGGGGGGSYQSSSGNMMYYSNFDTALTTLAFLSFGVFLLNMIFSFLDFGTPLGPITRDDGKDGGSKSKRSSSPTMSPAALLALNAIQESLMEKEPLAQPECAFKLFCDVTRHPQLHQQVDDMFSTLTSFILTGKLRTNRKLWATSKLRQIIAMLENGGCAELLRMCPNNT